MEKYENSVKILTEKWFTEKSENLRKNPITEFSTYSPVSPFSEPEPYFKRRSYSIIKYSESIPRLGQKLYSESNRGNFQGIENRNLKFVPDSQTLVNPFDGRIHGLSLLMGLTSKFVSSK